MTAVWIGLGWLAVATVLALAVCKAIRIADEIDAAFADYRVELPPVLVAS